MGTDVKLKGREAQDYRELLEALTKMVLGYVQTGDSRGVRRWASSLAHVGRVLLEHKNGRAA